jgi:pimeloyl-ACP methyl ester carboxylesterase
MVTTSPTIDHVSSADGTQIGFERFGSGPVLVLVQGAMGTAYSFRQLAEALAYSFTVIVPERRGRGLSPRPFDHDYTIQDDVRDLEAVLRATGGHFVFGLSSGADITLRAALSLASIERIAVFEPAVFLDGVPPKSAQRLDAYAKSADLPGVLVTGMKVGQFGPAALRTLPDWLVKPAIKAVMKAEAKSGSGRYAGMAELAAAFRYDFTIVQSMDGSIETFNRLEQPVLLLGGSKSPRYLTQALDRLEKIIPQVTRVEIDGADHAAAWNVDPKRNPRGNPLAVAAQLTAYFGAGP